jgi:acyl carrier protein
LLTSPVESGKHDMSQTHDPFVFVAIALGCDVNTLTAESGFGSHPRWDSVGHLSILAALEEQCGILIDVYTAEQFATMADIAALPFFGSNGVCPDGS